jgi:hypothetical protein
MSEEKEKNTIVDDNDKRTWTEELEVAGSQLVDRVQDLVKQGNVRRIVVRSADDKVILETSLTIGAVAGGVLMLTPFGLPLAILGAIAAVATRVKIEIVRDVTDEGPTVVESKKKVKIDGE